MTGEDRVAASSSPGGERSACEDEHCITCGDVATPMTVIRVDENRELALCEAETGERQTVEVALVAPVAPADRILVHAGTALAHEGVHA